MEFHAAACRGGSEQVSGADGRARSAILIGNLTTLVTAPVRALIELLAASGASELAVARSSEVLAAALLYLKPMLDGIVGRLTFAASPGSGFRIVPLKFFARHDPLAALQFFCIGCFFSLAAAESNTILGRPAGSFLAGPVFSEAVEVDGFCQAVLAEMSPEPPESVLAGHSPER